MRRFSDFGVLTLQVILGYLFVHFGGEQSSSIPVIVFCILLGSIAVVIAIKAFLDLKNSFAVAPHPHEHATLVTSGIYSKIRHPMYSSVLVLSIAYLLFKFNYTTLVLFFIIVAFFNIKTFFEERLLVRRYKQYSHYKTTTGKFFPKK